MDVGNGSYSFRQVSQVAKPELSVSIARIQINSTVVQQSLRLSDGTTIADARETYSSLLHTEELNHFLRPHTSCKRMRQMVSVFPINPDNQKEFAAYIASNLVRVAPLANTGSFQVEFEVSAKHHERTLNYEGEEEIMDCEEEEEITDSEEEEITDSEEEEEITDSEEEEEIMDVVLEESLEPAQQNSLAPPLSSSLQELKRSIFQEGEFRDLICVICQHHFCAGEKLIDMDCSHIFHDNCLLDWLKKHHICPVCRFELPKQPMVGH